MWGVSRLATIGAMLLRLRLRLLLAALLVVAIVPGAAQAADPVWVSGSQAQQWGTNCSIIGSPYEELQVTSQVSYGGLTTVPKAGERFNVVITYGHPGYACSGGYLADVYTELKLPAGVQLAIDAQHGIHCQATRRDGSWYDATNEGWQYPGGSPSGQLCKTTPSAGQYGGINLGLRPLITGTIFQIIVPVVSLRELKGMATTTDKFDAITYSTIVGNPYDHPGQAYNYQNPATASVWAVVAPGAMSVFYPDQAATDITATTAKLSGIVINTFAPGTAYVELGPTTAYGQSTPIKLTNQYEGNQVWATWDSLSPDTTYHWRVRFVADDGRTVTGADQTFRTAAAPSSPTGDGGGGTAPGGGTPSGGGGTGTPSGGGSGMPSPSGSASGSTPAPGTAGAAGPGAGAGATTGGSAVAGGPTAAGAATGVPLLKVTKKLRLAAARRALPVTVRVRGAGRVSVVLRRGAKVVARGNATVRAGGRVTVKLRPGAKLRKGALTVLVTFTPKSGPATTARARVVVR